ncbi:hypothetical protein QBC34DRAFT_411112 [Podospora aff. communis PSN243]|uniref:Uncharacterized protein n=1 Tax=Podospora aff. communis PSN243 TaxID=3040156 RepID=A0AAV9GDW4_9PEZI|nr:hypothetical protein QBC34DRAFT_411112 [Podospora aff. communis PSN243]
MSASTFQKSTLQAVKTPVDSDSNGSESLVEAKTPGEPPKKRRFYMRALSCVVIPPLIAAYFWWICMGFLQHDPKQKPTARSPFPDGQYIWWSWFVVGALGLNVSKYVLAGVEAGILSTPRYSVFVVAQISLHKDQSWAKASRWGVEIKRRIRKRHRPAVSWAWVALTILTMFSWSFVLTGLVMSTRDSFRPGVTLGVWVVGVNTTSYNARKAFDVLEAAFKLWKLGKEAAIPAAGAVYLSPDDDATRLSNSDSGSRVSLPSAPERPFFLAPQHLHSDTRIPLTGTSWGLLVRYSCSPVTNLSEFSILSQRYNSTTQGYLATTRSSSNNLNPQHLFYQVPGLGTATISRLQQPWSGQERFEMIAEVGLKEGISNITSFIQDSQSASHRDPEEESHVLEFALWTDFPPGHMGLIPELQGEYIWSHQNTLNPSPDRNLSAIGARCVASSSTGLADLDGIAGDYHNFRQEDAIAISWEGGRYILPKFGNAVSAMILPGLRGDPVFQGKPFLTEKIDLKIFQPLEQNSSSLLGSISESVIGYRKVPTEGTDRLNEISSDWRACLFASSGISGSAGVIGYSNETGFSWYVNPEDLQRALEEAHKHVVLALAYSQHQAPTAAWHHPNLTAALPWVQLVPVGFGPAQVLPLILGLSLLTLWAAGCLVLGLAYSFRKRWDASFSTRSLYWYCRAAGIDFIEVIRN